MTSDHSLEAVQDAGPLPHVTPGGANAASNEPDSNFDFSQLEGKDTRQQVCWFYGSKQSHITHDWKHQQLAILNHMMGKAVSIKEGAEAVLHGDAAQLPVLYSQYFVFCTNDHFSGASAAKS